MENVATKHGLGSTWRIRCENESCPSHNANSVFNSSEKRRAFEINRYLPRKFVPVTCYLSKSYCSRKLTPL